MTDSLDLFGGVEMPAQPGGHLEEADYWRARVNELLADKHELQRQLDDALTEYGSAVEVLAMYGFTCGSISATRAAVGRRRTRQKALEEAGSPAAIKRWLERHERDRRPLPEQPEDLIFCYLRDCTQKVIREAIPKSQRESEEEA